MGDSGRSRWSEGAGVVSPEYLERRFLNGALTSVILKRINVEIINEEVVSRGIETHDETQQ